MSRKYTLVATAAILIAAVIFIGVILANRWGSGTTAATASLRLAWLPGATFAGDYVALRDGFWSAEGIEVSVQPGGFDADALRSVASGADMFGVTSLPQLLFARANGVPVKAIGATIPMSPIGWVAKADSGISEPKDFQGRRIGAQFGTHTEITLEALCDRMGIPITSFQRVPVQFDPTPFVVGDIDVLPVYLIDQPVDLRARGIALNEINPADYGVALSYGNVYFTLESTIAERPELVRSFLAGARRGWRKAHDDHNEAVAAIRAVAPEADANALAAKLGSMFRFIQKYEPEYLGLFPLKSERVQETVNLLVKFGNLSDQVRPEEAFTNEFLDQ